MDNEMIERATKAAYEEAMTTMLGLCEPTWENLSLSHKSSMINIQIAAIKAMCEPTEKMIEAGLNCHMDCSSEEVWQAFIDAITADETYGSNSNPIIEAEL